MTEETKYHLGTGRRKTSVARVRMRRGSGDFVINGRELDSYFTGEQHLASVKAPLRATKTLGKFDVIVNVEGGGMTGQAGAVVLGVARALRQAMPDTDSALRDGGFLTRDSREKERKKYGRRGARRGFQFSKR